MIRVRSCALAGALSVAGLLAFAPSAPAVTPALLAPAGKPSPTPTPPPEPKGPRIYKLPYPGGLSFEVCQGNNHGTHTGHGAYAWDFCMPSGTPVTAARSGKVRAVRQDSNSGGWGYRFANDANYVIVDHGDGTSGLYMHLMFNGARVKPGDQVNTGQLLAYSGNTGWTSAPHLHFMVMQTVVDDPYSQSMPVLFQDVASNGGLALEDNAYPSGNAAIDARLMSPGPATGPPPFTPFWVETFRPSTLWSGPDDKAIQFGPAGPWQFFQVTAPQSGARLHVIVAATGSPAFVPAGDVGPSGPPPAAASEKKPEPALAAPASPTPAPASGQVVVTAGDTLYGIAKERQVPMDKLIGLNGLKNPNELFVGQILKIG